MAAGRECFVLGEEQNSNLCLFWFSWYPRVGSVSICGSTAKFVMLRAYFGILESPGPKLPDTGHNIARHDTDMNMSTLIKF